MNGAGQLAPCPECGREDTLRTCWDGREMCWLIVCNACKHEGPGAETGRDAREAWNEDAERWKELERRRKAWSGRTRRAKSTS